MGLMTINVENEQVKNLILEMDRNGMLKIVKSEREVTDVSKFSGALNMSKERMQEYSNYVNQSREEWDGRLSR